MQDYIATLEIRAGRDDLCKQYQAVRGLELGRYLGWKKQQIFNHSTRSELEPAGKNLSFLHLKQRGLCLG